MIQDLGFGILGFMNQSFSPCLNCSLQQFYFRNNLKSTPFSPLSPYPLILLLDALGAQSTDHRPKIFYSKTLKPRCFLAHISNTLPSSPLPPFPFPCPLFHSPPPCFKVSTGIRKALLQFHPDRAATAAAGDPKLQVEAEESFKILIREKAVLPLILDPFPSPRPKNPKKGPRQVAVCAYIEDSTREPIVALCNFSIKSKANVRLLIESFS